MPPSNPAPRQPTVRSLAQTLGISRTTVSEALRNSSRVNAETRQRVQEAARAAGYRHNPLAGSIMSEVRRSRLSAFHGVLAAVNLDEPTKPVFPGPFLRDLLKGGSQRALELGFKLEQFFVGPRGVSISRLHTILQSRGVRGVLLLPAWGRPDFSKLDWTKYTGVYADYLIDQPALHSVCPDHYRAMMAILPKLHAMGFRRPGLILQTQHNDRLQHRWAAAFNAYQAYHYEKFAATPTLIAPEITKESFSRWFREQSPDVVLAHRGETIAWMEECGARVPETHSFCCLNVKLLNQPCAGVDQQPMAIGARCIELLIGQLQRNEYGIPDLPCSTTVPSKWIDGPTLKARK